MDGIGGKAGWAWIFILEGLATVLAGIISFWIIQDFPDTAKFLTPAERAVVIRRLQADDQFSAAGEQLKVKYIWKSFADWKTWVGSKLDCLACAKASEADNDPLYAASSDNLRGLRHASVLVLRVPAHYHQPGTHCASTSIPACFRPGWR